MNLTISKTLFYVMAPLLTEPYNVRLRQKLRDHFCEITIFLWQGSGSGKAAVHFQRPTPLTVNSTLEPVAYPLLICSYQNTAAQWKSLTPQMADGRMSVNTCRAPGQARELGTSTVLTPKKITCT